MAIDPQPLVTFANADQTAFTLARGVEQERHVYGCDRDGLSWFHWLLNCTLGRIWETFRYVPIQIAYENPIEQQGKRVVTVYMNAPEAERISRLWASSRQGSAPPPPATAPAPVIAAHAQDASEEALYRNTRIPFPPMEAPAPRAPIAAEPPSPAAAAIGKAAEEDYHRKDLVSLEKDFFTCLLEPGRRFQQYMHAVLPIEFDYMGIKYAIEPDLSGTTVVFRSEGARKTILSQALVEQGEKYKGLQYVGFDGINTQDFLAAALTATRSKYVDVVNKGQASFELRTLCYAMKWA